MDVVVCFDEWVNLFVVFDEVEYWCYVEFVDVVVDVVVCVLVVGMFFDDECEVLVVDFLLVLVWILYYVDIGFVDFVMI